MHWGRLVNVGEETGRSTGTGTDDAWMDAWMKRRAEVLRQEQMDIESESMDQEISRSSADIFGGD